MNRWTLTMALPSMLTGLTLGACLLVTPLQAADPAQARTAAAGPAPDQAASMQQSGRLSVFTNGIGRGYHAVYTHANFDALMTVKGGLIIHLKDKGQRIGKPLVMALYTSYAGSAGRTVARPIATFDDDEGPLTNPSTIELAGKLEDDVDYGLTFAFEKDTISVRGFAKDPVGLKHPTIFRLGIQVPAYTNFPPATLQADREAKLKGLSFVIRRGQKKSVYPYANGAVFRGTAEKCWIEGPVYGDRKLSFECKAPDTAPLHPVIYPNSPPHSGYGIYIFKRDITSKKLNERLALTIQ